MLPFRHAQFIAIFVDYNAGVWPAQVIAYLVGLLVMVMLLRPSRFGPRVIGGGLAAMWLWTGIVYHGLYFSVINPAAPAFGALFVLQGLALVRVGATGRLRSDARRGFAVWLGWAFVTYALLIYPLIGLATGHRYADLPMFGITPCPVTIFTFGVMLLVRTTVPWWLLPVPFIWSLIGGSAAFLLEIPQDGPLLVSGMVAVPMVLRRRDRGVSATLT